MTAPLGDHAGGGRAVDATGRTASGAPAPTIDELIGLARATLAACIARGLTVATAESCTGGLVSHTLTEIAGSSASFRGGVVAYANEAKEALLGVDDDLLARHGAVSAEVAEAMADGARRRLGTDLAAAVTGIAGPDGGTAEKQVGLVYVCVVGPGGARLRRCVWAHDRAGNKRASAGVALAMLCDAAEESPERSPSAL
jgi:PncC family amidohydrolase